MQWCSNFVSLTFSEKKMLFVWKTNSMRSDTSHHSAKEGVCHFQLPSLSIVFRIVLRTSLSVEGCSFVASATNEKWGMGSIKFKAKLQKIVHFQRRFWLTFHQGTMRCSEPAKSTKVRQPSMSPVAMKMRHSLGDCCGIWLHDVIGRCCDGKTFQNLFAFLSQAFLWRGKALSFGYRFVSNTQD